MKKWFRFDYAAAAAPCVTCNYNCLSGANAALTSADIRLASRVWELPQQSTVSTLSTVNRQQSTVDPHDRTKFRSNDDATRLERTSTSPISYAIKIINRFVSSGFEKTRIELFNPPILNDRVRRTSIIIKPSSRYYKNEYCVQVRTYLHTYNLYIIKKKIKR